MARDQVQHLARSPQIFGWLLLAFVSTIAGNLTLVGSAANLIVVEKAMRHATLPVVVQAGQHFRVCCVVTLLSICLGSAVLYVETQLFL